MLPSLESMNLPPFWADAELKELEGSEVHTHAVRLQEELQEDFDGLEKKLQCHGQVELKCFHWAWSIYSSRVMSLTSSGGAIFAIVPGLDMLNHSPEVPTGLFKLDEDVVRVKAAKDLLEGEQAFINYADMYNSQMLLSFGFILDDLKLYSSEITLSLQVSARQLQVHRIVLDALEGPLSKVLHLPVSGDSELIVKHILSYDSPLPPAFLAQVRIQHLADEELGPEAAERAIHGLKAKDEMRTLFLISMLLEGKIQELQRPTKPNEESLALKQCSYERLVLQEAMNQLDDMLMTSIQKALMSVKSTAGRCDDEACQKAQTPWLHRLTAASSGLSQDMASVARLSKNFFNHLPPVHLIQACQILNAWLVGHETKLQRLCWAPKTWPFDATEREDAASVLGLESRNSETTGGYADTSAAKLQNPYLQLYHEKMRWDACKIKTSKSVLSIFHIW